MRYTRPPNTVEDFWKFVQKSEGCWEWSGNRWNSGYGRFFYHWKMIPAHRFSWEIANGPIPNGLYVCHSCDNKPCVRPDHLFLGTHQDNIADMMQKGRQAKGAKNTNWRKPEAADHLRKMNWESVRALRTDRANGAKYSALAKKYGIAGVTAWSIGTRRSYVCDPTDEVVLGT